MSSDNGSQTAAVKFERLLVEVRADATAMLNEANAGKPTAVGVHDLRAVLDEPADVERRVLAGGPLEPRETRALAAARIVIDTWPFDLPLGVKIMDLAALYDAI
jgi:hypothetical protein